DEAAAFSDHAVVPFPGGGIDRLTHRSKKAQARQIVRVGPLITLADERADSGRRSVENVDAILFDDAPPAVELGKIGSAFVHHAGCAGGEGSINDIAVTGDPAD